MKDMKEEIYDVEVNRSYKATMFEMIFSDKVELLKLYNAVNQTNYTNPDDLEINTLKNAIFLSVHNDISFVIDSRLSLYEHQSTYSPNLPLRYLFYIADLFSGMTKGLHIYGEKVVPIPTPRFLIFYNGAKERPEREILRLSDAYTIKEEYPSLELIAELININLGYNDELMKTCRTLQDYAEYTARVRKYAGIMPIKDAVLRTVEECIQEGILEEFLSKWKAEAIKMSIYEYDEEQYRRFLLQEGEERGVELKVLNMIQKKVSKGKSMEIIAEELEESVDSIRKYYDIVVEHPHAEASELLSIMLSK